MKGVHTMKDVNKLRNEAIQLSERLNIAISRLSNKETLSNNSVQLANVELVINCLLHNKRDFAYYKIDMPEFDLMQWKKELNLKKNSAIVIKAIATAVKFNLENLIKLLTEQCEAENSRSESNVL